MKNVFYCVALLFLSISFLCPKAWSQFETDKKLEKKLHALVDSFHGVAGIYTRNLRTNKEVAINADTIFPTASIVKVPILVGIFNKLEQGALTFHQPLVYNDSMARGGSGLMQFF